MQRVPPLNDIQQERFDIMVYGKQPYEAWAAMTRWQKGDFIVRLNKKAREEEQAHRNAIASMKR